MSALPCGKDLRMDENPATSVQPCEEASQRVVLLDGRPNRACRRVLLAVVGGNAKAGEACLPAETWNPSLWAPGTQGGSGGHREMRSREQQDIQYGAFSAVGNDKTALPARCAKILAIIVSWP